jgi:predicted ATP-dependent serine protease
MKKYRVKPNDKIKLDEWDPNDTSAFEGDKNSAKKQILKHNQELGELQELQHCLDYIASGNGLTVFVSGEAGAGKTRLTTEFLSRARKNGATVLAGSC